MGRVVAVSSGEESELDLGNRTIQTGIRKSPKPSIFAGAEGVAGDFVGDQEHHGGPDQALYVFFAEDYETWREELGTEADIAPGRFGENVLLAGFTGHELRIGDRFVTPRCTFEVTAPRIPCSTLSSAVGRPTLVKQFVQVDRPGFYARVVRPGEITCDDPVTLEPAPESHVTLLDVYREWYAKPHDPARLRRCLASPIAHRTRERFLERLKDMDQPPRT